MRHKIKNARQLFLVVLLHAFLEEKMVAISLKKSENYVPIVEFKRPKYSPSKGLAIGIFL